MPAGTPDAQARALPLEQARARHARSSGSQRTSPSTRRLRLRLRLRELARHTQLDVPRAVLVLETTPPHTVHSTRRITRGIGRLEHHLSETRTERRVFRKILRREHAEEPVSLLRGLHRSRRGHRRQPEHVLGPEAREAKTQSTPLFFLHKHVAAHRKSSSGALWPLPPLAKRLANRDAKRRVRRSGIPVRWNEHQALEVQGSGCHRPLYQAPYAVPVLVPYTPGSG